MAVDEPAEEPSTGRTGRWRRRRAVEDPAAEGPTARERTAGAVAGGAALLARLIWLVVVVLVVIIALAIAFVVLGANASNDIVSNVHDWAKTLVGPFKDIFSLSDRKANVALNYGLAILVYLLIAWLITKLITAPTAGWRARRSVR